jgi:hypothetical protein
MRSSTAKNDCCMRSLDTSLRRTAVSRLLRLVVSLSCFHLGSSQCIAWCSAGYYICGADSYSGAANCCAPCPAGQFIGASCGLVANWWCNACPAGTFSASTGSSSCTPCALGTISGPGAIACTACAPGTYTFGTGAAECTACPPGTSSYLGAVPCSPCPPGTYSDAAGARSCALCPAGTFGDHAGLSTAACSGTCALCTAGSTSPVTRTHTCSSASARAIPSSLGLLIWPAAHPQNSQRIDLVVAPLLTCQQLLSSTVCASASTIAGADGITRYVVGTSASLNVEVAETLSCAAS